MKNYYENNFDKQEHFPKNFFNIILLLYSVCNDVKNSRYEIIDPEPDNKRRIQSANPKNFNRAYKN